MAGFGFGKGKRGQQRRRDPQKQPASPSKVLESAGNEKADDFEATVQFIKNILGSNDDFVVRSFRIFGRYRAVLFYFANLMDTNIVNSDILKPLMYVPDHLRHREKEIASSSLKGILIEEVLFHSKIGQESRLSSLIEELMNGRAVIAAEGWDGVLIAGERRVAKRNITQPETEQVIRGPREGYIEQLDPNLAMLRYRLPTTDFRVEIMKIGRVTKTKVAVCFIDGIVNPALVDEVRSRLSKIDIDGILDSGYLEQFISDNHLTPFPLVQNTERPDVTVAAILEGRVTILSDGSPFALIVPAVFNQFYQAVDDYTVKSTVASFIRIFRLTALLFSLIFPSFYVSVISFNPELLPTEFAVAVAGGRAGVPFPSMVEVLMMEIAMEILREATVRLPQQVGGALSIVGVLVVGQAAVAAGFASPITVVVIALTTIGSFAIPVYNAALALRLFRFPLIIMAGMFGLYGVMVGLILITNHLLSLKSFGVPYISPIVPGNFQGMKDTLFRAPLWWMPKRPAAFHPPNEDRLGPDAVDKVLKERSNTLDPMRVGSERRGSEDGIPPSNHGDRSGDHRDQHD